MEDKLEIKLKPGLKTKISPVLREKTNLELDQYSN